MLASPIAHAHFRLGGGWRQNLLVVGAYTALVVLLTTLALRTSSDQDRPEVSAACLSIVAIVQAVFAILIAPGAVRRAVLRDFQTGMIESHRPTPLSGLNMVYGYLTGPTAQSFMLFTAGLIIGGYLAGIYGVSLGFPSLMLASWYASQLCLAALAFMVIAVALLTALATAGKTNLMVLIIIFGVFGGWFLIPFVPGLTLLMGVMSAGLVLEAIGQKSLVAGSEAVLGWAMLLQIAMAIVLIAASCRKARAPDKPVFSIPLSLALLAVTGLALVLGWRHYGEFSRVIDWDQSSIAQWVGSGVTFALTGLFALSAAAYRRHQLDRVRLLTSGRPPATFHGFDSMPILITAATALILACTLPPAVHRDLHTAPLAVAAPVLAAWLMSFWVDFTVISIALARGRGVFRLILLSWGMFKALPLLIEGVLAFVAEMLGDDHATEWTIAGLSPIGTLIQVSLRHNPWIGVAAQAAIAIGVTLLGIQIRRNLRVTHSSKLPT